MSRAGPAVLVAVLVLAGWAGSTAVAQPLFGAGQNPLVGSRVFGAKGCVKCHAVNGAGGKTAPDLGRVQRPRSYYDLAASLWNHAPRMAERMRQLGIARPRLDPEETANLVAFLFTLNYFDPPGNEEAGRHLFMDKGCVVCHQVGGTGGVIGPNLDSLVQYASPIYLAAAMWNHGPQMTEEMKARGIPRPTFKDTELVDLITYVVKASPVPPQGSLYILPGRAEDGRRLFAAKRCVECHSVAGRGGRIAPDLADLALNKSLTQLAASMWNKAPAMLAAMRSMSIPVPQLKPEEMADIVGYLYSVRYFAQAGNPANGAKVASAKGCLGCHVARGKPAGELRGAKGVTSLPGVLSTLWNHSFITESPPGAAPAPAWAEIRPDEMADLVAYLQSLRPAR